MLGGEITRPIGWTTENERTGESGKKRLFNKCPRKNWGNKSGSKWDELNAHMSSATEMRILKTFKCDFISSLVPFRLPSSLLALVSGGQMDFTMWNILWKPRAFFDFHSPLSLTLFGDIFQDEMQPNFGLVKMQRNLVSNKMWENILHCEFITFLFGHYWVSHLGRWLVRSSTLLGDI